MSNAMSGIAMDRFPPGLESILNIQSFAIFMLLHEA
jgi:hypothetical protein